jgi:hypothetical protein
VKLVKSLDESILGLRSAPSVQRLQRAAAG